MTPTMIGTGAVISECGTYRYSLIRRWSMDHTCCFVMLNPSKADAEQDDPTIRRCIGFAQRWGYGCLEVVNLFAFRSTYPESLLFCRDPVGPENDAHILRAAERAKLVVAAWSVHGRLMGRDAAVREMLRPFKPVVLGLTKEGHPRHPLYMRADTVPTPLFIGEGRAH